MDDTISRLAVIQIIEKMRARIGHNLERAVGGAMIEILDEVGEDVGKLPSALGTNLEEVGTDCISRQSAIDAFNTNLNELVVGGEENAKTVENYLNRVLDKIKCLPSVQLDTYWKEQCQSYEQTINKLRESLSTQPEIIRCKDCKHWMPYEWMFSEVWQSKNIEDYPEDEIGCACGDMVMKANDFCSRAERRTE